MKVQELRAALSELTPDADHLDIKVWLPGSTISLGGKFMAATKPNTLLIEGNIDPGSALDNDFEYEACEYEQ